MIHRISRMALGLIVAGCLVGGGTSSALADWDGADDNGSWDDSVGIDDSMLSGLFPAGFPMVSMGIDDSGSDDWGTGSWDDSSGDDSGNDDNGWDDHGDDHDGNDDNGWDD